MEFVLLRNVDDALREVLDEGFRETFEAKCEKGYSQ